MSRISADDVRKVAQLSRLELPDESIATFTPQLERILDFVAQLEAIDTTDVPPTTRAVEVVNVTRDDTVTPTPVREELLDQAPQRQFMPRSAGPDAGAMQQRNDPASIFETRNHMSHPTQLGTTAAVTTNAQ